MNPFDLPGPQFLQLYFVFGLLVLAALWVVQQSSEGGVPPRTPLADPYLLAYLRGGSREALRAAMLVLIDRRLLQVDDDLLSASEGDVRTRTANPFEVTILEKLSRPARAGDVLTDTMLLMRADALYREELIRLGLMPDLATRERRVVTLTFALVALVAIAGVKVAIGVSRGRPVGFLVVEALAFGAAAIFLSRRTRTALGDRLLTDLFRLFGGLRNRARDLRPHVSTSDLALIAALFGASHLSSVSYPHARRLVPRSDASSASGCGSGSSCGSSCGGGCGGGCGGCGS